MAKKMGKYCKAYYLSDFQKYPHWPETLQYRRKEKIVTEGRETESERPLTDKDILYLQENFAVTDGIFLEEHIVFDSVTPEWTDFCKKELSFEARAV